MTEDEIRQLVANEVEKAIDSFRDEMEAYTDSQITDVRVDLSNLEEKVDNL